MKISKINKLIDHIEYTVIAMKDRTKTIDGLDEGPARRSEREIDARMDRELMVEELENLVERLKREIGGDDLPF